MKFALTITVLALMWSGCSAPTSVSRPATPSAEVSEASKISEGGESVVVAFIGADRDATHELVVRILGEHGITAGFDGSISHSVVVSKWQSAEAFRLLKGDQRLAGMGVRFPTTPITFR